MGVSAPWADAYLEPQQKEQYFVMFINKFPTIHQILYRDKQNDTWCPLVRCLSRTQKKGIIVCDVYKYTSNNPPKYCPEIDPMGIGASLADAFLEPQQKEQSFVMFINLFPAIDQDIYRD